jgi:hypothetical protein
MHPQSDYTVRPSGCFGGDSSSSVQAPRNTLQMNKVRPEIVCQEFENPILNNAAVSHLHAWHAEMYKFKYNYASRCGSAGPVLEILAAFALCDSVRCTLITKLKAQTAPYLRCFGVAR